MPDFSMTRRNLIAAGAASGFLAASGAPFAMAQNAARRTLRVGMSGFPATLDPAMANATAVRRVVTNMFDKLLAFDQSANMALRPALAERWERVSGSALRLFLRKGVMFHDGSPFTAEDVAFSLSRIICLVRTRLEKPRPCKLSIQSTGWKLSTAIP